MNAKVALNTGGLDPRQKLTKLKKATTKLATEVATFPTPTPTLVVANQHHDDAEAVLDQIDQMEAELITLRQIRDQKMEIAMQSYASLANYVQTVAAGNPAVITDGGFDVALPPGAAQPLAKVQNNAVTSGDDDGTGDATWDRLTGAKSYEIEWATNPAGPYTHEATVTTSNHKLTNKPSGQKLWTRVRGINKLGPGPWSDPACCTIP